MKTSATESLCYVLDQRKQSKLQCLQNSSQRNGDNPRNIKRETSRTFTNKKRECLKQINEVIQTVASSHAELSITP
jgi:hypothetical protein